MAFRPSHQISERVRLTGSGAELAYVQLGIWYPFAPVDGSDVLWELIPCTDE